MPASTVQIFTGNSIAPRGDMASRSFVLPLNVDRPDPENRSFAHVDPLAWTIANRTKILSALYTVLIGSLLRRQPDFHFLLCNFGAARPFGLAKSLILLKRRR